MTLEAMERFLIEEALQRYEGKRKEAASALGINVSTLYRKIQALNITPPDADGRGRRRA